MKLQKWAVRAITCSKYNAHTDPIFKKLNILKVNDIYRLTAIKFYFKFKRQLLPRSFHDIFTSVLPSHNHATRQQNTPRSHVPRTVLTKSTVRFAIPDLIKQLPTHVTEKISSHSIQGLSNYAKKYFINQYKDSCSLRNCYVCRANVTGLNQS